MDVPGLPTPLQLVEPLDLGRHAQQPCSTRFVRLADSGNSPVDMRSKVVAILKILLDGTGGELATVRMADGALTLSTVVG